MTGPPRLLDPARVYTSTRVQLAPDTPWAGARPGVITVASPTRTRAIDFVAVMTASPRGGVTTESDHRHRNRAIPAGSGALVTTGSAAAS